MTTTSTRVLITAGELAERLSDPGLRVVEVDVSGSAFDDWHIDGAVLWNIYADLKDAGYHPVDRAALQRLLARSGIRPESTVVFYGYAPALGFWLLKLYGHPGNVHILNGSRDAWRGGGHPCGTAAGQPARTDYRLSEPNPRLRATQQEVREAIGDPGRTLLDVRSRPEYDGERFWPSGATDPQGRAGHLPHAVHQPVDDLYDPHGAFRPTAELSRIFSAPDLGGSGELITYCTVAGRAATAWFVLTYLLGRHDVRVYDGSWAEWGRTPDVPVETVSPQPTPA